jgi:DNA-binding transcriptional MerR regulator
VPDKTYTISELAQEFGITTRTIRFYEEKGLVTPLRDGQRRLFTPTDRVRIKLILRGKRIGMTLQECVEFIDMYDPAHNNEDQLHSLIENVKQRRERLLQQRQDIDDMLAGLDEVQSLCEASLANPHQTTQPKINADRKAS